jgi:hypothetical protein
VLCTDSAEQRGAAAPHARKRATATDRRRLRPRADGARRQGPCAEKTARHGHREEGAPGRRWCDATRQGRSPRTEDGAAAVHARSRAAQGRRRQGRDPRRGWRGGSGPRTEDGAATADPRLQEGPQRRQISDNSRSATAAADPQRRQLGEEEPRRR